MFLFHVIVFHMLRCTSSYCSFRTSAYKERCLIKQPAVHVPHQMGGSWTRKIPPRTLAHMSDGITAKSIGSRDLQRI